MTRPAFYIWGNRYLGGKCVILEPKGIEDDFELGQGISLAERWPSSVICAMDPEFPKDIELSDNLYGTSRIVISKRLRDDLVERGVANVEFLSVEIRNHKKKTASKDYFVLNPPFAVDCIDTKASQVKWNQINLDLISRCNGLVIRKDAVPAGVNVFRPKHLETRILIRADLAQALTDLGLTGLWFADPADFKG
jgi:hypothetical protein